jgi:hypothetical protein
MKIFLATSVLSALAKESNVHDISSRRYYQLDELINLYNPEFDKKKFWAYGCNCLIMGDRPMSETGYGPPVDELDRLCKLYKDCLKCAKLEHGNECYGESIEYSMDIVRETTKVTCLDEPGSCERKLCECDDMFAKAHFATKDSFNENFHFFWSQTGWDATTDCAGAVPPVPVGSEGGDDEESLTEILAPKPIAAPQCCGYPDGPNYIYNSLKQECCQESKLVASIGKCADKEKKERNN